VSPCRAGSGHGRTTEVSDLELPKAHAARWTRVATTEIARSRVTNARRAGREIAKRTAKEWSSGQIWIGHTAAGTLANWIISLVGAVVLIAILRAIGVFR